MEREEEQIMKYNIFRVLVDKGVIDIPDNATVIGYESGKTHSYNGTIGHSVIRNVHYAICMMPYREVEDDYDLEEEEHPAPELGNPIVPPIYEDMFEDIKNNKFKTFNNTDDLFKDLDEKV